jgi:hypothetical protein
VAERDLARAATAAGTVATVSSAAIATRQAAMNAGAESTPVPSTPAAVATTADSAPRGPDTLHLVHHRRRPRRGTEHGAGTAEQSRERTRAEVLLDGERAGAVQAARQLAPARGRGSAEQQQPAGHLRPARLALEHLLSDPATAKKPVAVAAVATALGTPEAARRRRPGSSTSVRRRLASAAGGETSAGVSGRLRAIRSRVDAW